MQRREQPGSADESRDSDATIERHGTWAEPSHEPGPDGSEPELEAASAPSLADSQELVRTRALQDRLRHSPKRRGPPARLLARGETVGRYVILERVGAGGMGVVYGAWDPDLDRKVALKLLHGERAGQGHRLLREAQAMARLSHPNVITVHDVGEVDGRVFVAMEFVEGQTLKAWSRTAGDGTAYDSDIQATRSPTTVIDQSARAVTSKLEAVQRTSTTSGARAQAHRGWREVLAVFVRAGRGLAAAHERGLVHRDFKPDNVMIGSDGRVRVMDFGLVRAATETHEDGARSTESVPAPSRASERAVLNSHSVLDSQLTLDGALLGTPAYMSPEQLRGQPADARSDQFSFCVALWECLYGERPFAGDNPLAVLFAISQGQAREPTSGRGVPAWLRRIIERGLAADPARRWPDMASLLAALSTDPSVRRRRWLLGLGSLALTGGVIAAVLGLQPELPTPPPPCHDVAAPLEQVWNEERANELGRAFAASGLVYAEDSRARVVAGLDVWADTWSTQRTDACEATEVRREQSPELLDLRMACLDQRLASFTALVELLVSADATVVERSIEAVENLPLLEPCADRAWLLALVRPPEDPALAEQVSELRRAVARVNAQTDAGKATSALGEAQTIDARARELAWLSTQAEAALALGRVQQELGQFGDARASYERAFFGARRVGDDETAIPAAYLDAYVLSVGLGDHQTSALWLRHAEAEADRFGRDDLRAEVFAMLGIRHYLLDEMQLAAKAFEQQVALHDRAGTRPAERGAAHVNYGTVLTRVDRRAFEAKAIAELDHGMALLEQAFGPDHPQLGLALGNYATALADLDRQPEAIERYERALRILERAYGGEHPMTALTQLNLGQSLVIEDRELERSLALLEASLQTHEAVFGPEHPMTAESLRGIGRVQIRLGRPTEALASLERAIAIWEASFGFGNDAAAVARYLRVTALLELDRVDEAVREYELIEREYSRSPAHARTPSNSLSLARRLIEHPEHHDLARSLLHRGRALAEREGDRELAIRASELEGQLDAQTRQR